MKCVIVAGGRGTRLGGETEYRPKPMVEIGGRPILWHIMKTYSHYGIDDFVICLGYKGEVIKDYFLNYRQHEADLTIDLGRNEVRALAETNEPWRVSLLETGLDTQTAGRLARIARHLEGETFCFTYGDGLADVPIDQLLSFHRQHGRKATVTAVRPPGRFGRLDVDGDRVRGMAEKPPGDGDWINGGFFVLEPSALVGIEGDEVAWEQGPMQDLAAQGEMMAFKHRGFWQPMDTMRDKLMLEDLWATGRAPWKVWV
ncbi:glucose-1-phosphate cytidylyltransferase [Magnetospirillum moscoviense]|uniref:Glucose-1-phosphate cytidylyltransferase n=1 Tax=Magnetospirillum moscoviense TaxID=1437059 RepID=A0A178M9G5_9PROT|nr:glucose-1-phosphate cytidylyltransferase [Magnetospirillum moscoviense]MBF0324301.1 glucose-1-phosphate cytidylyltransferase [Alphaproteobacteria bacterium]OAN45382.1 glucose-1-phosphate cytidylyltransferase [Magnetospirillum moscoviense]